MFASTTRSLQPTPSVAPAHGRLPRGGASRLFGGTANRVRWGMYTAFAALAVAMLGLGQDALRLEAMRSADAELLQQAGLQPEHVQHLGLLAVQVASTDAEPAARTVRAQALDELMRQWGDEALHFEGVISRQPSGDMADERPVAQALEAWQSARERLWYRSALLLRLADAAPAGAIRHAARAVEAEISPAVRAAHALTSALRRAAEDRAARLVQQLRGGTLALLLLLGVLSLFVVEPTARAVRRRSLRLREQAAELQRLALVAEHTSALVVVTDADDRVVWANAAFEQATGWPLADVLGHRPGEMLASPLADEDVLSQVHHAQRAGRGVRHEWLHCTRDGRDLWLDVDLRPLRDDEGRLTGHVRVCSDVTSRVLQQAKLVALWAALPAGVLVHAVDGRIVDVNRAAERLLSLSRAQMLDSRWEDTGWWVLRADGSPLPPDEHPVARTLASGLPLRDHTIGVKTPDGTLRWLLVNTEPQRDGQGQLSGVVACLSDVTESRRLLDRLADSARTDALTQLPNRAVVMERLERAIAHARRNPGYGFALLFMDFDRFKQVNDTLGHAAGDDLLRQIARRLEQALRPGDALARMQPRQDNQPADPTEAHVAARLGGDEFVVVLDGVREPQAVGVVADRLLHELSEPYLIDASPLRSSVSIGVVLCPGLLADGEGPHSEDLLRNADTAMYEAKRAGRGRWVLFDDSMHERLVRALELEADLRRALKAGELFVVYQPVVDIASRSMRGVEALVRWRHPVRGLVSPAEFIPVAEESGQIEELGAQVLQLACRQFMHWQRTLGPAAPGQLAVNLSRAQLKHAAIVSDVQAVLKDCGMVASQLQLEVTESLAAQDEPMQATLRALKALGVRLALDDFGTGYSSLACLHQMPVDTVKVDRSFVQHAESVEYHRVLIEATIRVARTLGMTTVAEGIETEGQAELMCALDCDRGQGYLFSRPLEPAALEAWVRERAAQAESADTCS